MPPRSEQPPRDIHAQIAALTKSVAAMQVTVEEDLMGELNAAIDILNERRLVVQEGFAGRAMRQPAARQQVPVANRVHNMQQHHEELVQTINRVTLAVCQNLALVGEEQARATWRELTPDQKTNMNDECLTIILQDHPELQFIENCEQVWPVLGLLQSKWTQISSHRRRSRLPAAQAQVEREQN
ncbi:hypothetical protein HMPREF1544_01142 [Mucor circinelloides 1006PhL]|uniref:Uncharacterized protein n=1 Tax=Mucor circinelloides f. circinelloides (strain 1006PhL) TaxID=1220926 RepID=S2K9F9_MUCC1|nr:hypothetical protein HMPREF1544_01142 [Mucor circinelloides 1006PhL]